MLTGLQQQQPAQGMRLPSEAGFTLLEMVVVIILLGILSGLVAPIFSHGLTLTRTTTGHLYTLEKLRYATERIAREVRHINHNGASYDITSMLPANLAFSRTGSTPSTVTINFSGSVISLAYSAPAVSATLTDEVSVFSFRYLDADGNSVGVTPANIAFVEVNLTLKNPDSGGDFSQRVRVALRDQS